MTNHCCNDEGHPSKAIEQKFETLHTETPARKRKFKEHLEIVRVKKKGKQVLTNNVTFESKKLFGLVVDRDKRNTLSQQETLRFHGIIFVPRITNRNTAQEREVTEWSSQQELSARVERNYPITIE